MDENEISYGIRGSIFKVYNNIGPGLLESSYEAALTHEIRKLGMTVRNQVALPMIYETVRVDIGYRMDLVVVEVKSVEHFGEVHHKQLLTYLRLSGFKLGILVNFCTEDIASSIFRKANGLKKHS